MTRLARLALLALLAVACGPAVSSTPDAAEAPDAGAPDAGPVSAGATFAATYALFAARCAGCHASPDPSGSLDLGTREIAHAALVNVVSTGPLCGRSGETYVVPGHPEASLLYAKLAGTSDCGFLMPSGPESGPVRAKRFTPEELQVVHDWIAAGAPND
jgi:hypothetical protein